MVNFSLSLPIITITNKQNEIVKMIGDMGKMKRIKSLRAKLILLCLTLLILTTSVIGISAYVISKNQLDNAGETQLKQNTTLIIGMINLLNNEVNAGNLTLEEAQEQLRQELYEEKDIENNARTYKEKYIVGETGYAWAMDENYIVTMDPVDEGMNLNEYELVGGVPMGVEVAKVAAEGGGFLPFEWLNPTTNKVETNLSYVEKDPNWGWIIASNAFVSEFDQGADITAFMIFFITIGALIIATIVVYIFASKITKPVQLISHELKQAASGNLTGNTISLSSKDEIGQLAKDFNLMKENMKQLIIEVSDSSEKVAASSEQLSASADETSKATSEITHSIQQVAIGSEQINNQLVESAQSLDNVTIATQNLEENMHSVSSLGSNIVQQASEGSNYISESVQQMKNLYKKINESNEFLQILDANSSKISEITRVITSIAEQTNLLALNAAIEAARAGEHGKGFAVVANEVRKLAEQTQHSSSQITQLIKDIQDNMEHSTKSMDTVVLGMQESLPVVQNSEQKFQTITDNMKDMDAQIIEISSSVSEIAANAKQISVAVNQITNVAGNSTSQTQQIAATTEEQLAASEEVSSASQSLAKLAIELQQRVSKFTISS